MYFLVSQYLGGSSLYLRIKLVNDTLKSKYCKKPSGKCCKGIDKYNFITLFGNYHLCYLHNMAAKESITSLRNVSFFSCEIFASPKFERTGMFDKTASIALNS